MTKICQKLLSGYHYRRFRPEEEEESFIILCKSEALHVDFSQASTPEFRKFGDLHMQVRLARLPQPEAGMDAFWHVC